MFASERPDFADPALQAAARAAYAHLLENIGELRGSPTPSATPRRMTDVTAAWATVHGLADLLQAGRIGFLQALPAAERETVMTTIIRRALQVD